MNIMPENEQEALDELLNDLRNSQAKDIAEEITRVIARGRTEEKEIMGRVKELSQRPLEPEEAYKVAIEMLIASLEPHIMQKHVLIELENHMGKKSSITWLQDFVEKSPIAPESTDSIDLPDIEGVDALERDLKQLIKLLGDV